MDTLKKWIEQAATDLGVTYPVLPRDLVSRMRTASPCLDAVFILRKGFIYLDNVPIGLANDDVRKASEIRWIYGNGADGNLLLFWVLLVTATLGVAGKWLNPLPYLASASYSALQWSS